jgi:L-asparaginase
MKIIIHGGFFSESSTNLETKIAKQQGLLRIVKDSYEYLKSHSALETVVYAVSYWKMMNCSMPELVRKFKAMEK